MCGRHIIYMEGKPENDFLPMPDEKVKADVIYLCSPNNPTGSAYNKEQLEEWVAYALKNDAVILYDAAYEAYVTDPAIPRSIFVIEDAKNALLSCALCPRLPALPVPVAVIPLFLMHWFVKPKAARKWN